MSRVAVTEKRVNFMIHHQKSSKLKDGGENRQQVNGASVTTEIIYIFIVLLSLEFQKEKRRLSMQEKKN